ncbi:MAG TPA: alanine racemase [Thermoanaerobaculia bacterium]|jgi:diaminopimelate decarboxylase|nr:alanine racemase [Thermoanaerobaculia bacterium]
MEIRECAQPTEAFLGYHDGVLCMEGTPLPELVGRVGTPFFLFSEARLRSNYQALERGLSAAGAGTVLRYCAKTNHEAAVLQVLARCGSHLLACHGAEVELALRCGFAPERIAFARPVLLPAELGSVLAAGVPLIHVHRPEDLPLVEEAAARAGRRVRVSLRLRQDGLALSPLDRLNRRLGFGPEEALEAVRRLSRSSWMEPWAVNFYLGTQQSSLAGFTQGFRRVLALLARIAAETGVAMREVNLGGGIPSPSLRRMSPGRLLARWRDLPAPASSDTLEDFASRLAYRFRELVEEARLPEPPSLAAEPGRSIVGGAAVLVTSVRSLNGRWAFLDASRSFLPESPLMFARRILPLAEPGSGERGQFYHLSGSSLNTLDVLDLHRRLPRLEAGQALAFCDAGAYSISRASSYAGLPPAVYLLQEDGEVRRVRRAGCVDDLLGAMILQEEKVEVLR